MTIADNPQTFFAYVGAATAGLVMIRIGKSIADGGDKIIQAVANRIAQQIDPPPDNAFKSKKNSRKDK
jgi:hypothetical protein